MPSASRTASAHVARTFTLLSLLTLAAMAQIAQPRRHSEHDLHKRVNAVYKGCYSSAASMTSIGTYTFQSSGYCKTECDKLGAPAMANTNGDECYCGSELPADSDKVDDSKCSSPCTGYGVTNCGGDGFFSVYATDGASDVPVAGSGSSSSGSGSSDPTDPSTKTSPTPSVVTNITPGQTLIVTITPSAKAASTTSSADSGGSGGGSNTAGIAAGVVVGVLAIAGLMGGLFFWRRQKKRKEAEEDYRKRMQVSDFMRGANERKPPSTGYSHKSDTRLDPEAGARRNSVGSLADNQDYSRRILRVANPDSS